MPGSARLLREYKIQSLLGAGSFGAVLKCVYLTDKCSYAVKVTPAADADAMREVENLVKVPGHKSLVQYYTCWKDSFNKKELDAIKPVFGGNVDFDHLKILKSSDSIDVICIQMELCGCDLRKTLNGCKTVNEKKAISMFIQLVEGVEHLHKFGIVHRDMKPENIFTSERDPSSVKIGDLGVATQHRASYSLTHTHSTGTRLYFAPEQEGNRYGKSVDIYALGIIFLEILNPAVQPGHCGDDYGPLFNMVSDLKFKQLVPPSVSKRWPTASNVILNMTSVDSDKRPSPKEIYAVFFEPVGVNRDLDIGSARLLREYKIQSLLGAGSFGAVLKCVYLTDKCSYAVKVTRAEDLDAMREVENLVRVPGHKSIVQYYTCWKDSFNKKELDAIKPVFGGNGDLDHFKILKSSDSIDVICIQMELCGCDLRKTLNRCKTVNAKKAISMFIQLVEGVEHLHKFGIVHRDMKPENIFTSERDPSSVKIGDLGVATQHRASHSLTHTHSTGTRLYFAPEQEGNRYGKSVDIYALGIIFLELLNPAIQPGHCGDDYGPLCNMVNDLKYKQIVPSSVSQRWPAASNVILNMTSVDSDKRPSPKEIYAAFCEPVGENRGIKNQSRLLPILLPGQNQGDQVVHSGVVCYGCGAEDIPGIRYKCTVCDDYDLCDKCEMRVGIHPETHPLIKIKTPSPTKGKGFFKDGLNRLNLNDKQDKRKVATFQPRQPPTQAIDDGKLKCTRCKGTLTGGYTIVGKSQLPFHYECFTCYECENQIGKNETHFTKDEKYYCVPDYHRLFTPKCAKCGEYCKNAHILTKSNTAYHYECRTCSHCHRPIAAGQTYTPKDGKIYCFPDCHKNFTP